MKVDEFIQGYEKALKSKSNVNTAEKYLEKHITRKYLPYSIKMAEARNIVWRSSFNDDNKFYLDSPVRYILFVVSVLTNYTDIEFATVGEDYDKLAECGAIEAIIATIGEDYDAFQTVVNMTLDDLMTNEREFVAYIEHVVDATKTALESVSADELTKAIQKLTEG